MINRWLVTPGILVFDQFSVATAMIKVQDAFGLWVDAKNSLIFGGHHVARDSEIYRAARQDVYGAFECAYRS